MPISVGLPVPVDFNLFIEPYNYYLKTKNLYVVMNTTFHIIIGGTDPFRTRLTNLLLPVVKEQAFISHNECNPTLLINAKTHPTDVVIIEDNFTDTDILIDGIKQIHPATKTVLFSPRKKSEIKNCELVLPFKIPDNLPGELVAILGCKPEGETAPEALKAPDISVFYKRELELFEGIMLKKSNTQMAAALSLSKRTIDTHRENLYKKANAEDVIDIVLFGLRHRWIDKNGRLTKGFWEGKGRAL
jgi:DNA-binding CsgD family transcriptional regulator